MKFRAGDLVKLKIVEFVDLFNQPFEADNVETRPVSYLNATDVAIVVFLASLDGQRVYIVGPHGCGWTFGAFLQKIK